MFGVPYEYDKAVAEVISAANDLLTNFGGHEGECTFTKWCPECKRPEDVCQLHSSHMKARHARLAAALDTLEEMRALRVERTDGR